MKSLRPTTALLIILVFGGLVGGYLWAKQQDGELPFPTHMASAPGDKLAILYGPDLLLGDNDNQTILSLNNMGVDEGIGGLAFGAEGNLLLGNYVDGRVQLLQCDIEDDRCRPFSISSESPKRSFAPAYFNDHWYVADTAKHRILIFDLDGTLADTLDTGFKYPNQLLVEGDSLFIANTNYHEILQLMPDHKNGYQRIHHSVESSSNPLNERWPISVARLGDYWWILNMDGRLRRGSIHRFSDDWEFVDRIELPANAEPVRMQVWENRLYITDSNTWSVLQYDRDGRQLANLEWGDLGRLQNIYLTKSNYYKTAAALFWVLFVIALGAGFIMAFRQVANSLPVIADADKNDLDVNDPRIHWISPNQKFRKKAYVFLGLMVVLILLIIVSLLATINLEEGIDKNLLLKLCIPLGILASAPFGLYLGLRSLLEQKIGVLNDWIILSKTTLTKKVRVAKGRGPAILHSPTTLCIGQVCIGLGNPSLPIFPYGELVTHLYQLLKTGTELTPTQMQVKVLNGRKGLALLVVILTLVLYLGLGW